MMRCARYAAAALFALLAVGFVALWVRSYYARDSVVSLRCGDMVFSSCSNRGTLDGYFSNGPHVPDYQAWRFNSDEDGPMVGGFSLRGSEHVYGASVPHWFLSASSLGVAVLLAFKRTWRYSLRTILIATTLLAGLLGLAVYAV